jgi:cytochrome c-type biogenesis protein CcmH/NrfG
MADAEYEAMSKAKRQRDSGNIDGALETLEDYLATDPHNTKPRLLLAQIATNAKRRDYGLMQLNIILDLEPNNTDARKALVTVLKQKKGDTKEADRNFRMLIEQCPDDAELMNSYAIFCKLQLTDFKRCEEFYKKAIELRPYNPEYHLNYAILLVTDMKNYTDGKAELEKAIELDPTNFRAKDALERLNKKKFNNGVEKKGLLSKFRKQ